MIDKLSATLDFDQQALGLRHDRQKVLAANIANADTPNYKARDFDFSGELSLAVEAGTQKDLALAATSGRHLTRAGAGTGDGREYLYRVPGQPSLDGNTVDMNTERVQFADNSIRTQAALTMMNSRIQGLKSAMQPE